MAAANRFYGKHLATCTIAGQDIKDIIQSLEVDKNTSTVDTDCLKDTERAQRAEINDGRIRFTVVNDGDFAAQITALLAAVRTAVAFNIVATTAGISYVSAGGETGILLGGTHDIGNTGGQTLAFEIVPDGSGAFS